MLIRRITLAALVAALVGGTLALPAASSASPVAHASKCKKKKGAKSAKKKKKCKRGQQSGTLPGQATHPNTKPPTQTPTPTVSDVTVASNPVLDGDSTTGQVTISGPAPSGGQRVGLQSDTARAAVPGSVVVAAGQTSASFPVDTTAGSSATATLTASIGTSSDQVQLSIVSDPSVASISLEHACFTPGTYTANRVTLDVPAPVDTAVTLASDQSAFDVAPGSVTVPSGSKTALFGALVSSPESPVTATVTATLGTSQATDSAKVRATAGTPAVSGVSLQPSSVTVGGSSSVTVTLDCEAPGGGTVVNLSSDQPSIANPSQATVTVPAGQLSATFSNVVDTFTIGTAHISADTGTGGPQQAQLDVNSLGT